MSIMSFFYFFIFFLYFFSYLLFLLHSTLSLPYLLTLSTSGRPPLTLTTPPRPHPPLCLYPSCLCPGISVHSVPHSQQAGAFQGGPPHLDQAFCGNCFFFLSWRLTALEKTNHMDEVVWSKGPRPQFGRRSHGATRGMARGALPN